MSRTDGLIMNNAAKNDKSFVSETFVSQNLLGLKSEARLEELFYSLRSRNLLAVCMQETWRASATLMNENCRLFLAGLSEEDMKSNRGEQGVGIALSQRGVEAWKEAGSILHNDLGGRIIALRLKLRDEKKRPVSVFLVSAYCPVGNADPEMWEEFLEKLNMCLSRKTTEDILLIGMDSNSSIGTMKRNNLPNMPSVGPHGLSHLNPAGERLRSYMEVNNLVALTTYFQKSSYATWIHPRSKNPHQIDHFITSKRDFGRVSDAGRTSPILDSDHLAIKCTMRIAARLKKRSKSTRQQLLKLDTTVLKDSARSSEFCKLVSEKFNADESSSDTYTKLSSAMESAAKSKLPVKPKAQPSWFLADEVRLSKLVQERNLAMSSHFKYRTRSFATRLRAARNNLKKAVNEAKNNWIKDKCKQMNDGSMQKGTRQCWKALNEIKKGLSKTAPAAEKMMTKADGTKCTTAEENAEVFRQHFEKLFDRNPEFSSDFSSLPEIDPAPDDDVPGDEEIRSACRSLKDKAPGDSGLLPQLWKALLTEDDTFQILKSLILDFWRSESSPQQWLKGLLKILPKKGDLSLPGNHRGIMLLEAAYKIVTILLLNRLRPIAERLDHEQQCGFRPGRGCNDAVFTVKMAMKKRKEHSQETWILFLDLVKAFDRVPRQLLWELLAKFGVPDKLVRLLKALHRDVTVKFEVDGITHEIKCTIGVKQGDILGPVLFIIFICGIMMAWRQKTDCPALIFFSRPDDVLTGRRHNAEGDQFEVSDSEYADDTAVLFDSRFTTDKYSPLLVNHFAEYGMEVHVGDDRFPEKIPKTIVLFVAAHPSCYNDPTTFDNANLGRIELGNGKYFPVVESACYLGSILNRECNDSDDVQARIDAAGGAFGALRKALFSNAGICYEAKRLVFEGLILMILLYGAESWCLTEQLFNKLRVFHARCARAMCRVNRRHTYKHRISTSELLNRLRLRSIDAYVSRRQLQWAGHVSRMGYERLPRKMLTSWVAEKRPVGCPYLTYGRSLYKALAKANIAKPTWTLLASQRDIWRNSIQSLK